MSPIRPAVLFVALAALGGARLAAAQDASPGVNVYLTVATGYWSRGLSQNDGGLALHVGADYQHRSGVFIGGGATDVDYEVTPPTGVAREISVDAYVGYHRRAGEWSWTVTLGRYHYPDGADRYDYGEIAASVGYRDRVFLSNAYTDDFYSSGRSASNTELSVVFPLPWNLELGATVGRFDVEFSSSSEFTHWNVGLSKVARRVVFDLRYHDSDYDIVTALGDSTSDQYVLSVSYGFRPKSSRARLAARKADFR